VQRRSRGWLRIVGVVGDMRGQTLDRSPDPEIYIPLTREPGIYLTVVARAASSTSAALAALRESANEIHPGQIVARPETMAAVLDRGLSPRRFTAALVASFAAVALLLAAPRKGGDTRLLCEGAVPRARRSWGSYRRPVCAKAGVGHFAHLLKQLPDVYAEWETREQAMRDFLGRNVSILRDRRRVAVATEPLTLAALRKRIEARRPGRPL
jgi:hypothetical protein